MFHILDADTADELWQFAAKWFMDGVATAQTSRNGETSEVLHSALSLRNPRQRWIASRVPSMNPAFAIAEVIWILRGRNDSAFLNFFNPLLPKFQGEDSTYHGAYGFRIRSHFGIDQLNQAYFALLNNPDSRQIVLQIWDSASDLPFESGLPRSPDVPCNIVALLKIRDGRLEWTQIMRSNDLFRGLPHNIVQFTTMQEVLAGWLGLEVGSYNHFSDSLHLYSNDGEVRDRIQSVTIPQNNDNLCLSKEISDRVFYRLSDLGDFLISEDYDANKIIKIFEESEMPLAYQNFGVIMAADALRRRGEPVEVSRVMTKCSNDCLSEMFRRWCDRRNGRVQVSTP